MSGLRGVARNRVLVSLPELGRRDSPEARRPLIVAVILAMQDLSSIVVVIVSMIVSLVAIEAQFMHGVPIQERQDLSVKRNDREEIVGSVRWRQSAVPRLPGGRLLLHRP